MNKYMKYRKVISNLPPKMVKRDILLYLDNLITIDKNEASGYNKGYTEACKNTNHFIIRFYNNL